MGVMSVLTSSVTALRAMIFLITTRNSGPFLSLSWIANSRADSCIRLRRSLYQSGSHSSWVTYTTIPFGNQHISIDKIEPAPTIPPMTKTLAQTFDHVEIRGNRFLSSRLDNCEPLADPESFGRGGAGVDSE